MRHHDITPWALEARRYRGGSGGAGVAQRARLLGLYLLGGVGGGTAGEEPAGAQLCTGTCCPLYLRWEGCRARTRNPPQPATPHSPNLPLPLSCLRLDSASKMTNIRLRKTEHFKKSNHICFSPCTLGPGVWWGAVFRRLLGYVVQLGTVGSLGPLGLHHVTICFVTLPFPQILQFLPLPRTQQKMSIPWTAVNTSGRLVWALLIPHSPTTSTT